MKKRWLAFAAACVMAFSLAGCVGGNAGTDNGEEAQEMHPWNGTAYGPYVLSAAEFPVQAPYPNEEDFFDENGTWRDKDYNDAYDAWAANQLNVTLTKYEAAAVPEFFARTAQVFLPEEEEQPEPEPVSPNEWHPICRRHRKPEKLEFRDYTEEALDKELIVKEPHDEIYKFWLSAQIDWNNMEYAGFNNTNAMFESVYSAFRNAFNQTHMPLGVRKNYF